MDKVCAIRHKVIVEGKSIRSVAREMPGGTFVPGSLLD